MFLKMPFLCDQCNKVAFCKIYTIVNHQRIHTGGKPFTCDHCNKRFIHKIKSYKTWELTHWEKTFSCGECDKGFTMSYNFTKTSESTHWRKANFKQSM